MNTAMMKMMVMAAAAATMVSAMAEGWSFSAGPAYRTRVKSSIRGTVDVVSPSSIMKDNSAEVRDRSSWVYSDVEVMPDDTSLDLYYAPVDRTLTEVAPLSGNSFGSSDSDSRIGLKMSGGYDFYDNGTLAIGVNLKFAGYWNLKSSASGASSALKTVRSYTDYIGFWGGPYPTAYDDTDFAGLWYVADDHPTQQAFEQTLGKDNGIVSSERIGGRRVSARLESDLYQLGIGPKFTWHATDWLDVYGGAEALCNIISMDVSSGSYCRDDTSCELGFGGNIGLMGYFNEYVGLYAEVGYEWINEAEVNLSNARMEVDYSSMVVSAGLVVRF